MEYYDPKQISNQSDDKGRYCYDNQPYIGEWNMERLKEALLYGDEYQNGFMQIYEGYFYKVMAIKLGVVKAGSMEIDEIRAISYKDMV